MRLTVDVSSPGVERELKSINHTLLALLKVFEPDPEDFSKEDQKVKDATKAISEAKGRIPHGT